MIEIERDSPMLPQNTGISVGIFDTWFMSKWEWSTSILEKVGAIQSFYPDPVQSRLPSPFSYPKMTLEECRQADFSMFESFDNYCYAMFTFNQFVGDNGEVCQIDWSPDFFEKVAAKDDLFAIESAGCVRLDQDRFHEKVLTRWHEMDIRAFERIDVHNAD